MWDMGTLTTTDTTLRLRFTPAQKLAGLLRDIEIPLSAIRGVEVYPDGLAATRGMRAPGLALPGYRKIGTWRGCGHTEVVDVRRGQPALRIELSGHKRDAMVVGLDDASDWARRLTSSVPGTG